MVVAYMVMVLAFLSFFIWIYQAIVLPSIRQRIRFGLFCLRDQTRTLVIEGHIKEDSAVFKYLHRTLNVMIRAIPSFDFALISSLGDNNPELKARAEKSRKLIEESSGEVQVIYRSALRLMAIALVANSLLWFVCFAVTAVPVLLSHGVWQVAGGMAEKLRMKVQPAFGLREVDLNLAVC